MHLTTMKKALSVLRIIKVVLFLQTLMEDILKLEIEYLFQYLSLQLVNLQSKIKIYFTLLAFLFLLEVNLTLQVQQLDIAVVIIKQQELRNIVILHRAELKLNLTILLIPEQDNGLYHQFTKQLNRPKLCLKTKHHKSVKSGGLS